MYANIIGRAIHHRHQLNTAYFRHNFNRALCNKMETPVVVMPSACAYLLRQ